MLAMAESFLHVRRGEITEAWELLRDAAEATAEIGSSKASNVSVMAGWAADLVGDVEHALAVLAQAKRIGEQSGQLFNAAAAAARMAVIYTELGMPDDDHLGRTALEYLDTPMGDMLASSVYADLGWAALIRGDVDEAERMFVTGVEGSSASRLHEASALLLGLAEVRIAQGDTAVAASLIDEALAFTIERGIRYRRPPEAFTRATLLLAEGRRSEAIAALGQGAEDARTMSMPGWEQRLLIRLTEALALAGRMEDADAAAHAARSLAEERASRVADPEIASAIVETTLARLPDLERIAPGGTSAPDPS